MKKLLLSGVFFAAVTLSATVLDLSPATHLNRWWVNCWKNSWCSFSKTEFDGKTVMRFYCVFPELKGMHYDTNYIICNFHGSDQPKAIKEIRVECANDAMSHLVICVVDSSRQSFSYTMPVPPSEKLRTVVFNFRNHDKRFRVYHAGGKNDGTFHWPSSGITLRVDADREKFLFEGEKTVNWYFGKVEVVTE